MGTSVRLRCLVVSFVLIAQLGVLLPSVEAAPPVTDPVVHIVRWGESVSLIARRYGTTTSAIVSANNLRNPNFVYAGQRLIIPTSGSSPTAASTSTYVVQRGDTLRKIAARYGTTVSYLASLNGRRNPNFIWVGQRLRVHTSSPTSAPSQNQGSSTVHVVQRGEILARIALRYGTTVRAIATANNLPNPSLIYVGQRLVIPGGGASPPSRSVPTSTDGRWIAVNLTTQRLHAYQGGSVVHTALVSTGIARYPTPTGTYRIQRKYRYDDMTGGSRARGDYYYLTNVPHCQYFYAGYSLHGTYWHSNFGTPMSHGCVNFTIDDSGWVYDFASVGTVVFVHY